MAYDSWNLKEYFSAQAFVEDYKNEIGMHSGPKMHHLEMCII